MPFRERLLILMFVQQFMFVKMYLNDLLHELTVKSVILFVLMANLLNGWDGILLPFCVHAGHIT